MTTKFKVGDFVKGIDHGKIIKGRVVKISSKEIEISSEGRIYYFSEKDLSLDETATIENILKRFDA
jgi:hypothetical protein